MDGNRRYGRQKHSDALQVCIQRQCTFQLHHRTYHYLTFAMIQGHWAGGQTLVDFIQWCMQDGIEIATVYAFSTENWNRDPGEVNTLMSIFAKYAESLTTEASTRNVRVRILSTGKNQVEVPLKRIEKTGNSVSCFRPHLCRHLALLPRMHLR